MVDTERSTERGSVLTPRVLSPQESFDIIWQTKSGEEGAETSFETYDQLCAIRIERDSENGTPPTEVLVTIYDAFTRQTFRIEINPKGIKRTIVLNQIPGINSDSALKGLLLLDPTKQGINQDSLFSSLAQFINRQFQSRSRI